MKGPGYTVEDLVFYTGLFGGIILVFVGLAPFGVHTIVRLIGGLVVGLGVGWAFTKAYNSMKSNRNDPDRF